MRLSRSPGWWLGVVGLALVGLAGRSLALDTLFVDFGPSPQSLQAGFQGFSQGAANSNTLAATLSQVFPTPLGNVTVTLNNPGGTNMGNRVRVIGVDPLSNLL